MRTRFEVFACSALVALLSLAGTAAVRAQSPTGQLVVTVKDPSEAVITGATVTVVNDATSVTQTATTTDAGVVTFPQLAAGSYTVNVASASFQQAVFQQVKIEVGKDYPIVAELQPGQVTESVTVTAGESLVQTTNSELTTTVTPRQVRDLHLGVGDPLQGSVRPPAAGSAAFGRRFRADTAQAQAVQANRLRELPPGFAGA